jgi:hypothetical protein
MVCYDKYKWYEQMAISKSVIKLIQFSRSPAITSAKGTDG